MNALDKDLADLRERQILDFDTDDVRSLRVAWTDDGRVAAVVDNQWRTITGPSELLVFRPGVVAAPR